MTTERARGQRAASGKTASPTPTASGQPPADAEADATADAEGPRGGQKVGGLLTSQGPDDLLKIGTVATRLGISERTLRYYEEVGLLAPHLRRPGGCRRYGTADVERVQRIRELQSLMGFNLEEIRRVVTAEDRLRALREQFHNSPDRDQERLLAEADEVLKDLRTQVESKIGALAAFLEELDARLRRHQQRRSAVGS